MATFSKLLEDMVVPIISRLPPKSILRFRCVSKLWSSLINNPGFVTKNLSIAAHNEFASYACILFKRTLLKDRTITDEEEIAEAYNNGRKANVDVLLSLLYICINDVDVDSDLSFVVEDFHIPFPSKVNPNCTYITGCCDGIVCLHDNFTDNIILCNPAIKEAKLLPRSVLVYGFPPRDEDEDNYDALEASTDAVGFGYDSITKEYKVIRIVEFTTSESTTIYPTRIEVYTLGAGDWREIKTDTICHVSWIPYIYLYVKGFCYWWGSTGEEQEIIILFNMSNEIFHHISLPGLFHQTDGLMNRCLVVWKETVAFFTYGPDSEVHNSLQMWVMNDFPGYNSSWTKHLIIGPLYSLEFPLVIWKSDELATVGTNGHIVSRNLHTKRLRYFPINGVEEQHCIQAVNYVDSMISLKGCSELESTFSDNCTMIQEFQ